MGRRLKFLEQGVTKSTFQKQFSSDANYILAVLVPFICAILLLLGLRLSNITWLYKYSPFLQSHSCYSRQASVRRGCQLQFSLTTVICAMKSAAELCNYQLMNPSIRQYYTVSHKKGATLTMAITLLILDRFAKFLTAANSTKFPIKNDKVTAMVRVALF